MLWDIVICYYKKDYHPYGPRLDRNVSIFMFCVGSNGNIAKCFSTSGSIASWPTIAASFW